MFQIDGALVNVHVFSYLVVGGFFVEILTWVFFFTFGLLLTVFLHLVIPSYLAIKTAKIFLISYKDIQLPLFQWHDIVFVPMLAIPLRLLLFHFGVNINMQVLEIPTWAPWVPEGLHHMYHYVRYPLPIAAFIARIINVLYFSRKHLKQDVGK